MRHDSRASQRLDQTPLTREPFAINRRMDGRNWAPVLEEIMAFTPLRSNPAVVVKISESLELDVDVMDRWHLRSVVNICMKTLGHLSLSLMG